MQKLLNKVKSLTLTPTLSRCKDTLLLTTHGGRGRDHLTMPPTPKKDILFLTAQTIFPTSKIEYCKHLPSQTGLPHKYLPLPPWVMRNTLKHQRERVGVRVNNGFTLFEILIAIFIFSIIGVILASTLHNAFNTQAAIERNAKRLDELQLAQIFLTRDTQQIINRPIINSKNQNEDAFVGTTTSMTFTHMGVANPDGTLLRSSLQRTQYRFDKNTLQRITWPAVDQTAKTQPTTRILLSNIQDLTFEYLDEQNHFQKEWPPQEKKNNALPRAIRISITLKDWGKMSELYILPN